MELNIYDQLDKMALKIEMLLKGENVEVSIGIGDYFYQVTNYCSDGVLAIITMDIKDETYNVAITDKFFKSWDNDITSMEIGGGLPIPKAIVENMMQFMEEDRYVETSMWGGAIFKGDILPLDSGLITTIEEAHKLYNHMNLWSSYDLATMRENNKSSFITIGDIEYFDLRKMIYKFASGGTIT